MMFRLNNENGIKSQGKYGVKQGRAIGMLILLKNLCKKPLTLREKLLRGVIELLTQLDIGRLFRQSLISLKQYCMFYLVNSFFGMNNKNYCQLFLTRCPQIFLNRNKIGRGTYLLKEVTIFLLSINQTQTKPITSPSNFIKCRYKKIAD